MSLKQHVRNVVVRQEAGQCQAACPSTDDDDRDILDVGHVVHHDEDDLIWFMQEAKPALLVKYIVIACES